MKTQQKQLHKAVVAGLAVGVAGLLVVGNVAAQTVSTMEATVQNTLDVVEVTPINFGTIFAVQSSTAVGEIEFAPDGDVTVTANGIQLDHFGGNVPGVFEIPNVTSGQTLGVRFQLPGTTTDIDDASAETCGNATRPTSAGITAPVLRLGGTGGDPGVARFCVGNFTTDPAGLGDGNYTVPFGVTTVEFNVGASLYTEHGHATTQFDYQEGLYTGSFQILGEYR